MSDIAPLHFDEMQLHGSKELLLYTNFPTPILATLHVHGLARVRKRAADKIAFRDSGKLQFEGLVFGMGCSSFFGRRHYLSVRS